MIRKQTSLYKLNIWSDQEESRSLTLTKIKRLTPTHVRGLDALGKLVEIKTVEPFNYFLQQIK